MSDKLFVVLRGGKFGYVDDVGRVLIEPRYTSAQDFSGGRAVVEENGLLGVIDPDGAWVVAPRYAHLSGFREGYCVFADDQYEVWGILSESGEEVTRGIRCRSLSPFACGLSRREGLDGRYDFIDTVGASAFTLAATMATDFSEGKAWISESSQQRPIRCIRANGEFAFSEEFEDAEAFSEGLAATLSDGAWALVTEAGKTEVQLHGAVSVGRFSEGCAWLCREHRGLGGLSVRHSCGYVDATGEYIFELENTGERHYDGVCQDFSEGMAGFTQDGLWGYVDKQGIVAIQPRFSEIRPFRNGLALVGVRHSGDENSSHFAYVNPQGAEVIVWDQH